MMSPIPFKISRLIPSLLSLTFCLPTAIAQGPGNVGGASLDSVQVVVSRASQEILSEQKADGLWNYPSHLGLMYLSQYYLMSHWLGLTSRSALQPAQLRLLILSSQKSDGSWEVLHDATFPRGDLNATIYHYWALKAMGEPLNTPAMMSARAFILREGGLQASSRFTRVFLALFGNFTWDDFPSIPYALFQKWSPLHEGQFAQWVGPHLIAIAYLKRNNVSKNLGERFVLPELHIGSQIHRRFLANSKDGYLGKGAGKQPDFLDADLVKAILGKQKPFGSFGGYTSATALSMAVLDHFKTFGQPTGSFLQQIDLAVNSGLNFIEAQYLNNPDSAYQGNTCDGRYWDTALVGQGLLEAGVSPDYFQKTLKSLGLVQNPRSGGFGFGHDFESFEDTDDTAEILLFFRKTGDHSVNSQAALEWLLQMQNDDGGWGAFARNNTGNFLLNSLTADFLDSADLFDESSPDVTGHILEALGTYGFNQGNSALVSKAVDYLRKHQESSFGGWEGRWGVNYIYGTAAAVIGLLKVGVSPGDPMVRKALDWLEQCPNRGTGGFGESFQSYTSIELRCGGQANASQTAWAMMALIEGGRLNSPVVSRAASFLTSQYLEHGRWIDASFVGTGHPKIVPMAYPSYAKSFPLMALSRYLKGLQMERLGED